MTTLISPDDREYETSDVLEIKRLTTGFGYRLKAPFDPAEHTVEEVQKHLAKNPNDTERVIEAERARGADARKTIIGE